MGSRGRQTLIIPDLNLIVYAYDSASPHHQRARLWWQSCLSGTTPVGIPWIVALGFVRLWTNSRIFAQPMTVDVAATHVESWFSRRIVQVVNPGPRHAELIFGFLRSHGKGGNLTTDAHLAALAVEFRAVVHTVDTDFLRFSGVSWVNPIADIPNPKGPKNIR
jgi:toxin-antitoxin system PIN domain toxin